MGLEVDLWELDQPGLDADHHPAVAARLYSTAVSTDSRQPPVSSSLVSLPVLSVHLPQSEIQSLTTPPVKLLVVELIHPLVSLTLCLNHPALQFLIGKVSHAE